MKKEYVLFIVFLLATGFFIWHMRREKKTKPVGQPLPPVKHTIDVANAVNAINNSIVAPKSSSYMPDGDNVGYQHDTGTSPDDIWAAVYQELYENGELEDEMIPDIFQQAVTQEDQLEDNTPEFVKC